MPHRLGQDILHHRNVANNAFVNDASILPRLTRSLYKNCIAAQRTLVNELIQEFHAIKEVGVVFAIRLNVVWKVLLEELLDKKEVIYEVIVERIDDEYRFFTRTLPHGSFESITCARNDISDDERPSTPDS